MNTCLNSPVVQRQWSNANILPVAKVSVPKTPSDLRPISITSVLSRTLERIVVQDFIYPSPRSLHRLDFTDQFAFEPGSSSTAALIHLLHNITMHPVRNQPVHHRHRSWLLESFRLGEAFDSVSEYASLERPDNIYNGIVNYFQHRSHFTTFQGQSSNRVYRNHSKQCPGFVRRAGVFYSNNLWPSSSLTSQCHDRVCRWHIDCWLYQRRIC